MEMGQVLLEWQITINGDKDVKLLFSEGQQLVVLDSRPPICGTVFT